MLALWEGWGAAMRAIIHDSLIMEVSVAQALCAARELQAALTYPIAALDGLLIGAEVMIGSNLAPHSPDNPAGMIEMDRWQASDVQREHEKEAPCIVDS